MDGGGSQKQGQSKGSRASSLPQWGAPASHLPKVGAMAMAWATMRHNVDREFKCTDKTYRKPVCFFFFFYHLMKAILNNVHDKILSPWQGQCSEGHSPDLFIVPLHSYP